MAGKRKRHARNSSTQSTQSSAPPHKRTWKDVLIRQLNKFETTVCANVLSSPIFRPIQKPLKEYIANISENVISWTEAPSYIDRLKHVHRIIANFVQLMKDQPDLKNREKWSRKACEHERIVIEFASLVNSVTRFDTPNLQAQHLRAWCAKHDTLVTRIREREKQRAKARRFNTDELLELRLQVLLLMAAGKTSFDGDVGTLSEDQLRALLSDHAEFLDVKVFDLGDYHRNHRCETCGANPTGDVGKYPSPPDGSGTPQIPGLFPSGPVTVEDIEKHKFRYVTGGTTAGVVRPPQDPKDGDQNAAPELALFIHFPDFHSASPELTQRLMRLARLFHISAKMATRCESNAAHQAIGKQIRGIMAVLGFRRARDEYPWGLYACPYRFRGERFGEYVNFMDDILPDLALLINMLFEESAGGFIAKQAQEHVAKFKIPPFGACSNDIRTWKRSLGANLTISYDNFTNECHLDGDEYPYVFSIYVFVDAHTGELITDQERIAKCMEGGYLIWPDLHLALKIVHCTGVVIMFWRGTHERHCTVVSKTLDKSIIRYGSSIQVNKRLFNSVQKYHEQLDAFETWMLNGGKGNFKFPTMPSDLDDSLRDLFADLGVD